jgi:hypothetical protein
MVYSVSLNATRKTPVRHDRVDSKDSDSNKGIGKALSRLVKRLRKSISKRVSRESSIRFRLLRESYAPRSWYAERSATVVILSYPKCGRTWLRMMLGRTLALHFELGSVNYLADDLLAGTEAQTLRIRVSHDDNPQWKEPAKLRRRKSRYRRQRVVFLVRDPRDVVVSMYFQRTQRERVDVGTMADFIEARVGSLNTILEYYNIWASRRSQPRDFLLIRYEDLQQGPTVEMRRLLDFVGLHDVSDAHIAEAVEFSSFDNMRAMEMQGELRSGRLRPRDRSDTESFKTRRGVIGGYVDYLEPAQIESIERRIAGQLDPFFGYTIPGGTNRRDDSEASRDS